MSNKIFITKSAQETKKIAERFSKKVLLKKTEKSAVVIVLQGELGAGKTTFLQGFAKGLGIKAKILSPTFILMKRFIIKDAPFLSFYHMDCYRLHHPKEVFHLGFKEIISDPRTIIAIEWGEKIKRLLPHNTITITVKHLAGNTRKLTLKK